MTEGQARRLAKKKAVAKANKQAKTSRILAIGVTALLLAAIVFGIVWGIVRGQMARKAEAERQAKLIQVAEKYDEGLTADGDVEGLDPEKYAVVGFNAKEGITIPFEEIDFTDDQVQEKINDLLSSNTDDPEVTPVFDDAFVKEKLNSDLTAEEYKKKIKEDAIEENKEEWLDGFLTNNFDSVDGAEIPEEILKTYAKSLKKIDLDQWNYVNAFYTSLTGSIVYDSVLAMRDLTEDEYENFVVESAFKGIINDLCYQILYKELGLEYDAELYKNYLGDNSITNTLDIGEGYVKKNFKQYQVRKYLLDNAKIVETPAEAEE